MFVVVMAVLDDHHPVVMMPAVVAMFAILGACAAIMIAIAVPDHDGFGTGDRRRRQTDGNDGRNDISKLLHGVLLLLSDTRIEHQAGRNVPERSGENSERMFRVSTDAIGWAKAPLRDAHHRRGYVLLPIVLNRFGGLAESIVGRALQFCAPIP